MQQRFSLSSLSSKAKGGAESVTVCQAGGRGYYRYFVVQGGEIRIILFQEKSRALLSRHVHAYSVYKANLKRNMQHTYTHTHTHTRGVSNLEPGIYTLRSFCVREGEGEREWGKLTKTSRRR